MLSFISGIITALSAADAEKAQGRALRQRGNIAASNANRQADATMRTADLNWSLESDKRKAYRRKQTHRVADARNRDALSGFSTSGTGSTRETLTSQEFDEILSNLTREASISYTNYFNNANATRTQGILQQQALHAEAYQHDLAASAIRRSTAISAAIGAAAADFGYWSGVQDAEAYNEKYAAQIHRGDLKRIDERTLGFNRASYYSSELFNNFQGFNSYTASLTRKNNWGAYTALANGATPGFNRSEFTL